MLEAGRVCVKTRGREAGRRVVVVDTQKGAVVIEGIGVKKRKCNPLHLFPTMEKIDLKKGASHEDIVRAMGQATKEKAEKKGREGMNKDNISAGAQPATTEKTKKKGKEGKG